MTEPETPHRRAYRALQQLRATLHSMNVASMSIRALQQPEGPNTPIHLLDADVVCGGLRSFALASAVVEHASGENDFDDFFNEALRLSGPHTLRFVVGQMNPRAPGGDSSTTFTFPSGARYELLVKKAQLKEFASSRSQTAIDQFDQALHKYATNPLASMRRDGTWLALREAMETELLALDNIYGDTETLDGVLSAALPIEELIGEQPQESELACINAFSQLGGIRKRKEKQNKADAVNVGQLVWLLAQPKALGGVSRLPLLISESPAVSSLEQLLKASKAYRPQRLPDELRFFHNHIFLLLSTELTRRYGGFPMVIRTMATTLSAALKDMTDKLELVQDRLVQRGELSGPEWDVLQSSFSKFDSEFGQIVQPVELMAEQDRVSYQNELLSVRFADAVKGLEANGHKNARSVFEQLRGQVLERSAERGIGVTIQAMTIQSSPPAPEHSADREIGATTRAISLQSSTSSPDGHPGNLLVHGVTELATEPPIAALFQMSVAPDHFGRPIASFDKSQDLQNFSTLVRLNLEHPTRVVVWPKFFSFGRIPMVVDCWKKRGLVSISVAWPCGAHQALLERVLLAAIDALAQTKRDEIQSVQFPQALVSLEATRSLTVASLQTELRQMFQPPSQSIELTIGDITFFADLEPIDDQERQVGVLAPRGQWEEKLIVQVLELMTQTNAVSDVGKFARDIIKAIVAKTGDGIAS